MDKNVLKQSKRDRKKKKIRSLISGTNEIPRCSVFRSLNNISAQIIDDKTQKTLVSLGNKNIAAKGKKVEQAYEVGQKLAELAISKGIKTIVFDRNGYIYHGRIKSLAEGLRAGGLTF